MNQARGAASGALALILTQVVTTFCQFAYSSVTARLFTPAAFGEFAAALTLESLAIVLASSGLPSFLLSLHDLSQSSVRYLRGYALAVGLLMALLFVPLSEPWLHWLNASGGDRYVPLLAVAIAIAPLATVESSLLRREHRQRTDAVIFGAAFVVSVAAALAVGISTKDPASLAVAPAVNFAVLLVASFATRRLRRFTGKFAPTTQPIAFVGSLTAQNLVFLGLNQAPALALGAAAGPTTMGSYSRATTLASVPGSALATALIRASQPSWRHVKGEAAFGVALLDTVRVSAAVAMPVFGVLAVLGPYITPLWLGPGWGLAAQFVPPLAVASALFVPYSVVVSALEVRGRMTAVRISQVGSALALAAGIGVYLATSNSTSVAIAVAASQGAALLGVLFAVRTSLELSIAQICAALLEPMAWAVVIASAAFVGSRSVSAGTSDPIHLLWAVLAGGSSAVAIWFITVRWHVAIHVLRRRGINLPPIIYWRPRAR